MGENKLHSLLVDRFAVSSDVEFIVPKKGIDFSSFNETLARVEYPVNLSSVVRVKFVEGQETLQFENEVGIIGIFSLSDVSTTFLLFFSRNPTEEPLFQERYPGGADGSRGVSTLYRDEYGFGLKSWIDRSVSSPGGDDTCELSSNAQKKSSRPRAAWENYLQYSEARETRKQTLDGKEQFRIYMGYPPEGKEQFCRDSSRPGQSVTRIRNGSNRLAFRNQGGILDLGTCWWHSRFVRNAAYITYFEPNEPQPTREQAIDLIDRIAVGETVVPIPGYRSLSEFSKDWEEEIQARLDSWQISKPFAHSALGLSGSTSTEPEELRRRMDVLYQRLLTEREPVFQMLQYPDISAHSWLVLDMKPHQDGYLLTVADSNTAHLERVSYTFGDRSISYEGKNFVAYTAFDEDLEKLESAQATFCSL